MSPAPVRVDARGHRCPVPSLKLARALDTAAPGETIVLIATDPMARIDVPHMLGDGPHRLVGIEDVDGVLRITVETGAAPSG
ncbi:MAG: sulfurtransferase TusA family protein [Alphaproteobacteria bacterium]|nr:sulfurtransferase TusA family protein [Alphaproteobacteria bacterium]